MIVAECEEGNTFRRVKSNSDLAKTDYACNECFFFFNRWEIFSQTESVIQLVCGLSQESKDKRANNWRHEHLFS